MSLFTVTRQRTWLTHLFFSATYVRKPHVADCVCGRIKTPRHLYKGYSLKVRGSHQSGKADTSVTAKAIIGYFNQMGIPLTEKEIPMERNPDIQRNTWGIPEACIGGHGWHTYTLTSEDQTVTFEFTLLPLFPYQFFRYGLMLKETLIIVSATP